MGALIFLLTPALIWGSTKYMTGKGETSGLGTFSVMGFSLFPPTCTLLPFALLLIV